VDADLKSYFDAIPHTALMARVKEKVADGQVLGLLAAFLTAKVMETAKGWTPEKGLLKGQLSARCSPISIWIPSTSLWPGRDTRW